MLEFSGFLSSLTDDEKISNVKAIVSNFAPVFIDLGYSGAKVYKLLRDEGLEIGRTSFYSIWNEKYLEIKGQSRVENLRNVDMIKEFHLAEREWSRDSKYRFFISFDRIDLQTEQVTRGGYWLYTNSLGRKSEILEEATDGLFELIAQYDINIDNITLTGGAKRKSPMTRGA